MAQRGPEEISTPKDQSHSLRTESSSAACHPVTLSMLAAIHPQIMPVITVCPRHRHHHHHPFPEEKGEGNSLSINELFTEPDPRGKHGSIHKTSQRLAKRGHKSSHFTARRLTILFWFAPKHTHTTVVNGRAQTERKEEDEEKTWVNGFCPTYSCTLNKMASHSYCKYLNHNPRGVNL